MPAMGDAHGWYDMGRWPARSNLCFDLAPSVVLGAEQTVSGSARTTGGLAGGRLL